MGKKRSPLLKKKWDNIALGPIGKHQSESVKMNQTSLDGSKLVKVGQNWSKNVSISQNGSKWVNMGQKVSTGV